MRERQVCSEHTHYFRGLLNDLLNSWSWLDL